MTRIVAKFLIFTTLLIITFSFSAQAQELSENASLAARYAFILKQKFSDPEGAHLNATLLLQKSETENNQEFIFKAYYQLARIANIQGDHKTGMLHAKRAEDVAKAMQNDVFICKALLTVGNTYVYLGDDENSLLYYLQALKFAKKSKHIRNQIMARGNIAKVKRNVHFDKEALEMFQENFKLCQKHGLEKETIGINTYLGLTGTFLTLSQPDSTIFYAKPGLHFASENKDVEGESYFYIDMGIAYYMKSEFEKAIMYLKKAATITLELKNKKRLVEVYYYLGKSYLGQENYTKAVEFLELTKTTVTQENNNKNALKFNPHILLSTHELLADVYKKQGKIEKSNASFEQYKALDKLKDIDRTNVYETLLDNVQQEKKQLTYSESKLKDTVKIISVLAFLVFACCIYFIWRWIKVRKKNKIIFEQLLEKIEQENLEKKKSEVTIQDKKVHEILARLDKLEASLFFLNSNCTLQNVAKKIKTNTSYLSKIIGSHKQKKFTEYINELRIQYVVKRLKEDAKFRKYSIKNIAEEIGYKSTNSFTKHFKAYTKLYPSFYIQNLNEKEKKIDANL
ncbi:helix-turn-helix domain-containing protein [Kordia jejudonensis]|uniref:helix-turn-helix domain-containing protein n=1 Tax=Kordia jejudonensis TaxID=1348245 RepID=UPI0006292C8B|nr:helix-turn-helix domain-containing protein [Kordia jejudonensis]